MKDNSISNELIYRAQAGDKEAANEILINFQELVSFKARHFFIMGAERDDVIQEGMLGLLKAIKYYNEERVSSFRAFAELCIHSKILSAIRDTNTKKNSHNNSTINDDGVNILDSSNPELVAIAKDSIDVLSSYFKGRLSKLEWYIYNELLQGFESQEIAEKVGKSTKSIDNAIQRIRRKGKEWLKNTLLRSS